MNVPVMLRRGATAELLLRPAVPQETPITAGRPAVAARVGGVRPTSRRWPPLESVPNQSTGMSTTATPAATFWATLPPVPPRQSWTLMLFASISATSRSQWLCRASPRVPRSRLRSRRRRWRNRTLSCTREALTDAAKEAGDNLIGAAGKGESGSTVRPPTGLIFDQGRGERCGRNIYRRGQRQVRRPRTRNHGTQEFLRPEPISLRATPNTARPGDWSNQLVRPREPRSRNRPLSRDATRHLLAEKKIAVTGIHNQLRLRRTSAKPCHSSSPQRD